jgi:hypothetical protein
VTPIVDVAACSAKARSKPLFGAATCSPQPAGPPGLPPANSCQSNETLLRPIGPEGPPSPDLEANPPLSCQACHHAATAPRGRRSHTTRRAPSAVAGRRASRRQGSHTAERGLGHHLAGLWSTAKEIHHAPDPEHLAAMAAPSMHGLSNPPPTHGLGGEVGQGS